MISFQNDKNGYLIHSWLDKTFQCRIVNQRCYLNDEDNLKLFLDTLQLINQMYGARDPSLLYFNLRSFTWPAMKNWNLIFRRFFGKNFAGWGPKLYSGLDWFRRLLDTNNQCALQIAQLSKKNTTWAISK